MNMLIRSTLSCAALLLSLAAAKASTLIRLDVDARKAPVKVISVEMSMPVTPGPLTLYYPKWIPGEHRPDGPIENVTGLRFSANGSTISWQRDALDAFAFHVTVPAGANQLKISFDYIEPSLAIGQLTGGASATDQLVVLNWNQFVLYPAGSPAQVLLYEAHLQLPTNWKFGTALQVTSDANGTVSFSPTPLNRLVDSPLAAGQYFRAIDLTPPGEPIHHEIDIVADSPEALAMSPQVRQSLINLVAESGALFGTRHYRAYHFLLTLSDLVPHFGLEHHESDDSRAAERTLLAPDAGLVVGRLLAHELTHSWNGKFRRPIGMAPPYYEEPMKDDMLWAYEGITNYLGYLLAARSGLWTNAQYHQFLASIAAELGPGRPGRTWRPLVDTGAALPVFSGLPGWINWSRTTDFHIEGALIWLEAAMIIDRQTHGSKSFDDFCKLFYGGPNEGPELRTYTFDDLVHSLNEIAPYDWASFLQQRVQSTSDIAPTEGIEASGWRVSYTSEAPRSQESGRGAVDASYSLGLTVTPDGQVTASIWGSPAFQAGVTPGMKIIGVNGRVYTHQRLLTAIENSPNEPVELLVTNEEYYKTRQIDYHGGPRYPQLIRVPGKPDYLDSNILRPRTAH